MSIQVFFIQCSYACVNTKFFNCRKSNHWKEIWFANINLYWWIMSTISISILLQKNTVWFYLLWTCLEQEIILTLVGRWIERSSQQIYSFELIRDLLFFKSSNIKARRLKFFEFSLSFKDLGLLKFMEAFKLDSSLGRRIQMNFFLIFFEYSWGRISPKF